MTVRFVRGRALAVVAASIGCLATAAFAPPGSAAPGAATSPADLPAPASSPPVDPAAPYTPLVRSLIDQLLPDDPPTLEQLTNAGRLFAGRDTRQGGDAGIGSCHTVGRIDAPTGTDPSIAPMCWADSVGIDVTSGPNKEGSTAPPQPLALAASFDVALNNAWGQVEAAEGRQLMVTGLYGPQVDVTVHPNWQRGLDTFGEDPLLASRLGEAQVHGMQGRGLMAQVKHLAGFSASDRYSFTEVQDQALHEIVLPPFESTLVDAGAASTMCAYNGLLDDSEHLPAPGKVLFAPSPYGEDDATVWPLDEAHYSCEQPFLLNHVLRTLWGSLAFVGSDYPSTHSTSAAAQGLAQEFPFAVFLGATDPSADRSNPLYAGDPSGPTGNTCALVNAAVPCDTPGATHVGGIPGPGCPEPNGCGLVDAVHQGVFPLVVFKQMLALVLYQQERFGMLGCESSPPAAICTNPGGVAGDRSGNAPLPAETRADGAAVVQRAAEEGAVLLQRRDGGLPIDDAALTGGIAVSGAGADHLIAAPSKETAVGFADRNLISPLDRLRDLSGDPASISYTPAGSPTGIDVPTTGLTRDRGPGAPAVDPVIDFTTASDAGPLAAGDYRWTGSLQVDAPDRHIFRLQVPPSAAVSLSVDGQPQSVSSATSPYCGQYYLRLTCVPADVTRSGTTEPGLANLASAPLDLAPGPHRLEITFRATTPSSFRFAYSRDEGDAAAAAAAAAGKAMAVVFVNDDGVATAPPLVDPAAAVVPELPAAQVRLIQAVAAANPRTVVVLNTAGPVVTQPWIDDPHVVSVLEMWNAGGEGGTATARLLLGLADPSGRTPITWPKRGTDTIWAYDQPEPLYPGDTAGTHPERLNGATDTDPSHCLRPTATGPCTKTVMSQGIFSGYRFHDQLGLEPQFPFGHGLTYTSFSYSDVEARADGAGVAVSLRVTNTGKRSGTAVPQVYLGPSPGAPDTVQQAPKSLAAFDRVELGPGESQRVDFEVPGRALQYWDEVSQSWVTPTGRRAVLAGEPGSLVRTGVSIGERPARPATRTADGSTASALWAIGGGMGSVLVVGLMVWTARRRRA